jgi:rhodanese-related sulfurtransferase
MNLAPLKLVIAPIQSKSFRSSTLWIPVLFLMVIGTVGWGTYRRISTTPLAMTPVPMLKTLPHLKRALLTTQLPQITAQALKEKIDRQDTDYVLVDVRSSQEFQASRIPSAISIPWFVFQKKDNIEHIKALLNGRKLIVYGTSGHRSANALLKMNQQGLSGIHLVGGMNGWQTQIEAQ